MAFKNFELNAFQTEKRNKYGAKKTPCLADHIHDSKFEASCCNSLSWMKRANEILGFERQKPFKLVIHGSLIATHIVDFWVQDKSGEWYVVEAKGKATKDWIIKYKLFRVIYPGIRYEVWKK